MNIEFIKIEIQNFKSVGETIIFDYDQLKGLNFVYGKNLDLPNAKNGSGKSTILVDSIVFALFGKTLKNTNNRYIPNRFVSDKLKPYVKIYLRSNGQLYSCETYGRINSNTMSTIGMEVLKLNDDYSVEEDLTQSSVNKTKEFIQENILGCSFNVFKSSIVISAADFMNFYEGMNKDQKRKYIETIFNLDCFGEMFSMIKTDINDIKRENTSTKNEILQVVETTKDLNEKFETFNESLIQKKNLLKNKITEKLTTLKKLKEEDDSIIFETTDELEKNKNILNDEIQKLSTSLIKLDKFKLKNELEIKHINEMITEMKKISEGLCEKCTKLMNERYDYTNKQTKITEITKIIEQIINKTEKINSILSDKNSQLNNINKKIKENEILKNKKQKINYDINYLKEDLKKLKDSFNEIKDETINPFESLLNENKTKLNLLKERLTEFNKNLKHLDILKETCSETGIKKFIMKDIVKLLNSLIQKYLNEIGSEFIVYFDETFEFKFLTSSGECEFSNFSAGERQRIQIATILAFRDLILNGKIFSNIFIIDELLDANIDSTCIENVMNILKRKSNETSQNIFIVSHRAELADNESLWDNIIKVIKENGQSTYEIK